MIKVKEVKPEEIISILVTGRGVYGYEPDTDSVVVFKYFSVEQILEFIEKYADSYAFFTLEQKETNNERLQFSH